MKHQYSRLTRSPLSGLATSEEVEFKTENWLHRKDREPCYSARRSVRSKYSCSRVQTSHARGNTALRLFAVGR